MNAELSYLSVFFDLRLTPDLFSSYLIISSFEGSVEAFRTNNASQNATFPLDVIPMTITIRKCSRVLNIRRNNKLCVYQRTCLYPVRRLQAHQRICLRKEDSVGQLLMEYALQHMTSFYSAIIKGFDIDCSRPTVDCTAMHHFLRSAKNTFS